MNADRERREGHAALTGIRNGLIGAAVLWAVLAGVIALAVTR